MNPPESESIRLIANYCFISSHPRVGRHHHRFVCFVVEKKVGLVSVAPEYFGSQRLAITLAGASQIFLDVCAPYRRQTFQNRCRIRTPNGLLWLSIPLRRTGTRLPIRDMPIDTGSRWAVKHWRSLEYNYRSSPYFEYYEPFIAGLYSENYTCLGEFSLAATRAFVSAVGIKAEIQIGTDVRSGPTVIPDTDLFTEVTYRQNFPGYFPGTSIIDRLFNLGPNWADNLG